MLRKVLSMSLANPDADISLVTNTSSYNISLARLCSVNVMLEYDMTILHTHTYKHSHTVYLIALWCLEMSFWLSLTEDTVLMASCREECKSSR